MRRSRRWTDDEGSSSLEFITAGLVLLLPLIYLVLVMAAIQGATLAAEGAARHAARVFVQQPDVPSAQALAETAVRFALADHGIEEAAADVEISCSAVCLQPHSLVTVTVSIEVPLPLVPAALPGDFPLSIGLSATAVQRVSGFGP